MGLHPTCLERVLLSPGRVPYQADFQFLPGHSEMGSARLYDRFLSLESLCQIQPGLDPCHNSYQCQELISNPWVTACRGKMSPAPWSPLSIGAFCTPVSTGIHYHKPLALPTSADLSVLSRL